MKKCVIVRPAPIENEKDGELINRLSKVSVALTKQKLSMFHIYCPPLTIANYLAMSSW